MTSGTLSLLPEDLETRELHAFLLGAVAPRPIAFASTVDAGGTPNLAPFSYFNVFGTNPPVLIFSPARRVRDNTVKHTLVNAEKTREVVVNMVSYGMVQQMSLASTEYPEGVNEFEKAGFGMVPSDLVKPYRVAEAPAQFECRVTRIMPLGEGGGSGNLIFCEVVKIHLKKDILSPPGLPDPKKMDLVARLGGNWYSRAAAGLFEVPKPLSSLGIGVDAIPEPIRLSDVLTGNDLGKLGNVEKLPDAAEVSAFVSSDVDARKVISARDTGALHRRARQYLEAGDVDAAWKLLLAGME